jgi:putative tributyrin esterase
MEESRMGIMRFNFRSQAIGGYVNVSVVYPTDFISYYDKTKESRHHIMPGQKPYPQYIPGMKFQTVYLIHGGGDDDSLTYRYTNAELFAQRNNVMLVTPSVVNSFGVDTNYGVEYSKFITEELPVVIQTLFASSPKREDNFIMGYAMGGNAALGNALMRPDLYSACIDISGGIGLTVNTETLKKELNSDHMKSFKLYGTTFGKADEIEGSRHDMRTVAQRNLDQGVELPKFYLIAGSEEGFIGDRVKADAETLKKMGYDVTYICAEGYKHYFELWNDYIKIALDELLPLKREPIYPTEKV